MIAAGYWRSARLTEGQKEGLFSEVCAPGFSYAVCCAVWICASPEYFP
jgi:predicted cupin superfamily sugar epimerase